MQFIAREVMTQRYHTLTPDHTVAEAVRTFKTASRDEGRQNLRDDGDRRQRSVGGNDLHV